MATRNQLKINCVCCWGLFYIKHPGFVRVFDSSGAYLMTSGIPHGLKVINKRERRERRARESETCSLQWVSVFGFAALWLNVLLSIVSQSSPSARITVIRLQLKTSHLRLTKSGRMGLTKYCNVFMGEFRGGQDSTLQHTKMEKRYLFLACLQSALKSWKTIATNALCWWFI